MSRGLRGGRPGTLTPAVGYRRGIPLEETPCLRICSEHPCERSPFGIRTTAFQKSKPCFRPDDCSEKFCEGFPFGNRIKVPVRASIRCDSTFELPRKISREFSPWQSHQGPSEEQDSITMTSISAQKNFARVFPLAIALRDIRRAGTSSHPTTHAQGSLTTCPGLKEIQRTSSGIESTLRMRTNVRTSVRTFVRTNVRTAQSIRSRSTLGIYQAM